MSNGKDEKKVVDLKEENQQEQEQEDEEARRQAEEAIGQLDDADWLERDGYYRVVVHFGERDKAILCAISGDAVSPILDLVPELSDAIPSGEMEFHEIIGDAIRSMQDAGLTDKVWKVIDQLLAQSLVEWHMPEYEDIRGEEDLPVPNADMPADERMEVLRSLPLPMLARMIAGVLWLSKNW